MAKDTDKDNYAYNVMHKGQNNVRTDDCFDSHKCTSTPIDLRQRFLLFWQGFAANPVVISKDFVKKCKGKRIGFAISDCNKPKFSF